MERERAGERAGWKEGQRGGRLAGGQGERPSDISRERESETAEGNTQLGLQNNRKPQLSPDSIMHTTHCYNMVPTLEELIDGLTLYIWFRPVWHEEHN